MVYTKETPLLYFPIISELCAMADLEELPKAVEKLYTDLWAYRKQNLTTYKNDCYRLEGDSYIKLR